MALRRFRGEIIGGIANTWLEENSFIMRQDLERKVHVFELVIILLPLNKHNSVLDTRDTKMNMTKELSSRN